jgi:hypothetical protein
MGEGRVNPEGEEGWRSTMLEGLYHALERPKSLFKHTVSLLVDVVININYSPWVSHLNASEKSWQVVI